MATPTTLPATFVAGNVLTAAQMNDLRGAFRVLQVVSTTKQNDFTTASTTYVDVTGLSQSITPSSTSSKVLVIVQFSLGTSNNSSEVQVDLVRGSTSINRVTGQTYILSVVAASPPYFVTPTIVYLDDPATTSATTYKLQAKTGSAGTTAYIGSGLAGKYTSNITLMEISL